LREIDNYSDGHISREEKTRRVERIDRDLAKLEAEQADAQRPSPLADPKVRRDMLGQVRELLRAWASTTPEEARAVVNVLTVAAGIETGQVPRFVWRTGEELHERLDVLRERLLAGLGRAPSWTEVVEALGAEMLGAAPASRR
jgi:hypothetical protein